MYLKCGVVGGVHRVHRHLAALPAVQAVQLKQYDDHLNMTINNMINNIMIISPLYRLLS